MAVSKEFVEAVESGKTLRIRIMLKDILIVDPAGERFDEMEAYANAALGNIYDEHDGETLSYDATGWNEDYLNDQMVAVVSNFSKERIELLKSMVRYIYRDKVQKIRSEDQSIPKQGTFNVSRKQIGAGVTVAGAALAVAGICTSHTILAIGGVAVAAAGIVLIVTDKE